MREELKPCPFCGGKARPTAHLTYSWFAPVCKSCGVRGPSVRIESGSDPQKMRELMNKADALWNRRSAPVAQPVAWAISYNGKLTANVFVDEEFVKRLLANMVEKFPNDKGVREIVPLYTEPKGKP